MPQYTLHTDGGARGNPGPAGIGFVLKKNDKVVAEGGEYIGEATNNVAEYQAILAGLRLAKKEGVKEVACFLDSLLVVEQLKRNYKVKDPKLGVLFVNVWNLIQEFKKVTFQHIRREENAHADRLVNEAIDAFSAR